MASVEELVSELIRIHFSFYPEAATEKGYRGFDHRLGSYTEESVRAYRAALRGLLDRLPDPRSLPDPDDRADVAVIESHARTDAFFFERLKWHRRSPYFYVSHAFSALDAVLESTDLDEAARREVLISRLGRLPRLLQQARLSVTAPIGIHLEAALEMLKEGLGGVRGFAAECRAKAPGLRAAIAKAERAMADYAERLEKSRASAEPFQPMGRDAFAFLLRRRHLLETAPEALAAAARTILDETTRRIALLESLAPLSPEAGSAPSSVGPADRGQALPLTRRKILDYFLGEIELVRRFLLEKGIVSLPASGEIAIRETPPYLLPIIPGLSYQPPASFGTGRRGILFIRPLPRRISRADSESWQRRMRHGRFRNAVVHEVFPGHHLQVLRAIESPRALRRFDENDFTMEGWALYCEEMMADHGFWGSQPPIIPVRSLRFRAARAIADIGIHTGQMTLEGAVDFLVDLLGEEARGFLETEVRRYALEPGQALSYLAGRNLILALRHEMQEALGAEFDLCRFHDVILSQGTIPLPIIAERTREILLGDRRLGVPRGRPRARRNGKRAPGRGRAFA